jgi:hypothetical protein
VLLTAVPFLRRMTWRLPDTYHSAGTRRGTATLKFYEGRDILLATGGCGFSSVASGNVNGAVGRAPQPRPRQCCTQILVVLTVRCAP